MGKFEKQDKDESLSDQKRYSLLASSKLRDFLNSFYVIVSVAACTIGSIHVFSSTLRSIDWVGIKKFLGSQFGAAVIPIISATAGAIIGYLGARKRR